MLRKAPTDADHFSPRAGKTNHSDHFAMTSPTRNDSHSLHQISNADFKSVRNGLNCEQRRIFHTALNATQESPVNVGFCGKSFLRQLSFQPHFPNSLSELFRNVMAHVAQLLSGHASCGCRLYPTVDLTRNLRGSRIAA